MLRRGNGNSAVRQCAAYMRAYAMRGSRKRQPGGNGVVGVVRSRMRTRRRHAVASRAPRRLPPGGALRAARRRANHTRRVMRAQQKPASRARQPADAATIHIARARRQRYARGAPRSPVQRSQRTYIYAAGNRQARSRVRKPRAPSAAVHRC